MVALAQRASATSTDAPIGTWGRIYAEQLESDGSAVNPAAPLRYFLSGRSEDFAAGRAKVWIVWPFDVFPRALG
jgi:hypothetical protein